MRSSVIDLGSNTFHLLVADADRFGIRKVICDHKIAVRIGDRSDAAHARGVAAFEELVGRSGGRISRVVATGVFRDPSSASQFLDEARQRSGLAIDVLDPWDEGRLTWTGVSSELAGSHGKLAVIDLGGGSLECVLGTDSGTVDRVESVPVGVLRLRGLSAEAVRARVTAGIAGPIRAIRAADPDTVALSSGTPRALFRLARRLGLVADGQRHVWRRTFGDLARMLIPLRPDALTELGIEADRLDTIAAGAIVLDTALELLGKPVAYVARSALREGALIDLARHQPARSSYRAGIHAG